MPNPAILPTLLRETIGPRRLAARVPEGGAMDGADRVADYAKSGREPGIMAASYLFHAARITQTISGARFVIDLGCGPATQLAQVARLNPRTSFLGVDLSADMIAAARAHVREQGLENVTFRCDDISRLDGFGDASVDGVVSTMALHHLPSLDHLAACFRAIARVLKPGGALYLVDFGLLKSERSIAHFVAENRPHQSAEFSLEFEQSMKAAFMPDELGLLARAHLPRGTAFHRTFQIPLLNVAKSPDRPIAPELLARFRELRAALPAPYKRQLDDMRLFFWLGGLRNDPFRRRLRAFSPVAQAETSPSA